MKTVIGITLIVLAIGIALFLKYGSKEQQLTLDETLMFDHTEKFFISTPDKELFKLSLNPEKVFWDGYRIRLVGISNVDYVPSYDTDILPEYRIMGNIGKRKKLIEKFYSNLDSSFEKVLIADKGYENSAVYVPFTRELIRLTQSPAKQKRLVIYSDLMEHSALLNFYQKSILDLMNDSPQVVWDQLQVKNIWPDLTGIEVIFIYQPKDQEENKRWGIVSEFYKAELERKGAKVSISAN